MKRDQDTGVQQKTHNNHVAETSQEGIVELLRIGSLENYTLDWYTVPKSNPSNLKNNKIIAKASEMQK